MSNILLHLCSTMPAVFCIDGKQIGCCDHPCQYLEVVVCQEKFVLYVYPIEQISTTYCSLSYSTMINCLNSKPIANTNLVTITDYGQCHYVICAKPLLVPRITNNLPPCYDTCDTCTMSIINNNINITNQTNSFNYTLQTPLKSAKIQKINDFYAILGKNEQNFSYVMLLNDKLQFLFDKFADKIELTKTSIITLEYAHDIAQHGQVTEYAFNNGNITKEKSYTVYIQDTPITPATPYAIPYAFLEAIALNDFTLARSYLHPALSQNLQNDNIRNFFGNFIDATPTLTNEHNCIALIYSGNPQFVKKYKFELSNDLIKNINSID